MGGITITGHADLINPTEGTIVDWKTKKSFYPFKSDEYDASVSSNEYIDQVTVYMHLAGVDQGRIIFISMQDWETMAFPEGEAEDPHEEGPTFEYDKTRFERVMTDAWTVRNAIIDNEIPTCAEDIPFEKCGCWKCEKESLTFPNDPPVIEAVDAPTDQQPALANDTSIIDTQYALAALARS